MYRAILRRETYLNELMHKDYDRFVWLKKELGIVWEPANKGDERRSTRYGLFRMETKMKARADRMAKLDALKKIFEVEKVKFFEEKEKILKEINEEIKELGFELNLDDYKRKRGRDKNVINNAAASGTISTGANTTATNQ